MSRARFFFLLLAPACASLASNARAEDLRDRLLGEHHQASTRADARTDRMRVFSSMQLRSTGSSSNLVGEALPVDAQMGALCGSLLAWRIGAQLGALGAYGVLGGGTWTVYRHTLPTAADRTRLVVDTGRAGYGFVGLGTEWQVFEHLIAAAEVDFGRLAIGQHDDVVMAPSPASTVQSAVAGLRFDY